MFTGSFLYSTTQFIQSFTEELNCDEGKLDLSELALLYAIYALGSSVSIHPGVIGFEEPRPRTMSELNHPCWHARLASFGTRRSKVYQFFKRKAFEMAKRADTLTKASRLNATCCFLLQQLIIGAIATQSA